MSRLSLFIICLLLLVVSYLIRYFLSPATGFKEKDNQPIVETYIDGAYMQQFSAEGSIKNTLTAPSTVKMTQSSMIDLAHPTSSIHLSSSWIITADKGQYDLSNEVFSATGHVNIKRDDGLIQINADHLDYHINTQIVVSDTPVELKTPQGSVKAKGVTADLNTQSLELHKDISTRYHAPLP